MRNTIPFHRRWLLAVALLASRPPAAMAHAILMDGFPLANGTMPPGRSQVRLRFNSRIDVSRSRLVLVLPDHSERVLAPQAGPTADIMLADVTLAPGPYRLNWQVLAVDGHITRGSINFTVVAR